MFTGTILYLRETDGWMRFERLVAWGGGGLFVASLAVLAAWLVALGRSSPFSGWPPMVFDGVLFLVFATHHSLLARPAAQKVMRRFVPEHQLRTVYVWTASTLLILVCWLWQPIGGQVFRVTGTRSLAHIVVALAGVLTIALSVRAIDALELAGIRKSHGSSNLQITGPYRLVRHPLYLGWMLLVFAPANMTGDRLFFAAISSAYLVVAIPWEEASLEAMFGGAYVDYKRTVRSRVIPYVY
jgi:protein-S-isoprenylcysteine O-methyltransferase Ste14